MLKIFGNKDTDPTLCEELGIKWFTKFIFLGQWFDQTLEDMEINYDHVKKGAVYI